MGCTASSPPPPHKKATATPPADVTPPESSSHAPLARRSLSRTEASSARDPPSSSSSSSNTPSATSTNDVNNISSGPWRAGSAPIRTREPLVFGTHTVSKTSTTSNVDDSKNDLSYLKTNTGSFGVGAHLAPRIRRENSNAGAIKPRPPSISLHMGGGGLPGVGRRRQRLTPLTELEEEESVRHLRKMDTTGDFLQQFEDAMSSKSHFRRVLKNRVDPSKIFIFLSDWDLRNFAVTSRGNADAVRTFHTIKFAKLNTRETAPVESWWKSGMATRGGGLVSRRLMRALSKKPPKEYQLSRYESVDELMRPSESDPSKTRFLVEYEEARTPVVVTDATRTWHCTEWTWTIENFAKRFPNAKWRFNDLHGEEIRTKDYMLYVKTTDDDSPLGVYDSQIGTEASDPRGALLREYVPPSLFAEDIFTLLPKDDRPPHRWVLMGTGRSGTGMHVDPLGTSAWVTLVSGRKRWVMYPPDYEGVVPGVEGETACEWFSRYWPLKVTTTTTTAPSSGESSSSSQPPEARRVYEILQCPGETVFVPGGWKHVVINLENTVAVTHNYAPYCRREAVVEEVRIKEPRMYEELIKRLPPNDPIPPPSDASISGMSTTNTGPHGSASFVTDSPPSSSASSPSSPCLISAQE